MKKVIVILIRTLLCSLISSCSNLLNDEDQFKAMERPIIVIAKGEENYRDSKDTYKSIVIRDNNGKPLVLSNSSHLGTALYVTYSVGDTLR